MRLACGVASAFLDSLSFDPFSPLDDGLSSTEVGIGGCHVIKVLVIALMVVVFDERLDLGFKIAWQEVVLKQNTVLQSLVPPFDLALGLRMERRAAHMALAVSTPYSGVQRQIGTLW